MILTKWRILSIALHGLTTPMGVGLGVLMATGSTYWMIGLLIYSASYLVREAIFWRSLDETEQHTRRKMLKDLGKESSN